MLLISKKHTNDNFKPRELTLENMSIPPKEHLPRIQSTAVQFLNSQVKATIWETDLKISCNYSNYNMQKFHGYVKL